MVDEGDDTAAPAAGAIAANDCIAREGRFARAIVQFCLLKTGNEDAVFGEKIIELRHRTADTIAVPRDDTLGWRRARVWVNPADEEEEEEEESRDVGDDEG